MVIIENIQLYNGECLDVMKNIPSNSIQLAIIDPPYKLNKTTGGLSVTEFNSKWQGNLKASDKTANIINDIKFKDWLPDVYRVLAENSHCYLWVNDKNLSDLQTEAEKVGFRLHNILVWKKNNCTPNKWYMKNCEFILFLHKGKSFPINNLGDAQFYDCLNINGKDKLHPTQKPLDYTERMILNSSKEGDCVLDCFMGSGTTGVSAKKLGRKFIGIEIDNKHFNIAENRILTA